MIITNESDHASIIGSIQIRVDPHDGLCHGDHAVVVSAIPTTFTYEEGRPKGVTFHATLTWQSSALLSVHGSLSFAQAIVTACDIADQIMREGEYRDKTNLHSDRAPRRPGDGLGDGLGPVGRGEGEPDVR